MGKDICKSTEEDCGERDARNPRYHECIAYLLALAFGLTGIMIYSTEKHEMEFRQKMLSHFSFFLSHVLSNF